ncbi:MAG: outer membrane lipoprotein carrier protein LolA [Rhodospirillales bacterium]|nr:outer membrane lipoprotein carrier protein LolA [Rhodospirillales bacterium]MCB9973127.1 outer membrane lipoprotein carrier protein LolA [Rhodospirillales bacterium]
MSIPRTVFGTIFAAGLLFLLSLPAQAAVSDDISAIEKYLNSLKTAQAKFEQFDPDGELVTGTFYLSRPGRLRFEYDPPLKDFVVADGTFIYFYDAEVQEQSHAPIGQTLADFILRPNLSLNGDIQVKDIKRAAGLLQVTLVQTADPDAGSIMLGLTEKPMTLKKWRVVDAQGAVTEITLTDFKADLKLPDSLFFYRDPSRDVRRYNN